MKFIKNFFLKNNQSVHISLMVDRRGQRIDYFFIYFINANQFQVKKVDLIGDGFCH